MTEYDTSHKTAVLFPPTEIKTTLAAEIAKAGLTQVHVAETEKYAHATYFLNGGRETPHDGERHILVESRKDVTTHDQAPKMRAKEIADEAVKVIEEGTDFIFINFANADMVGHTGNHDAVIVAVEEVDVQLKRVVEAALVKGGVVFITADHGNAETSIDLVTGETHTAHTSNVVPAILTQKGVTLKNGTLADVAPTILKVMDVPQPEVMTGKSLIT
jgi:2,3-bisphosphoglycerate-independent phosphoglycerate mutase